jgi:hypothetical protein
MNYVRPLWVLIGKNELRLYEFKKYLFVISGFLLIMLSSSAHAGSNTWTIGPWACPSGGPAVSLTTASTGQAANSAHASKYNSTCFPQYECYTYAIGVHGTQSGTGTASGSLTSTLSGTKSSSTACTGAATVSSSATSAISCTGGTLLNSAGACVTVTAESCPARGTEYSAGYFDIGTSPTSSIAAGTCAPNSCGLSFSGESPAGVSTVAGVKRYYAKGTYDYVGGTPDPACAKSTPTALATIPPATCATGSDGGYVNGSWVCLARSGSGQATTADISGTKSTTTRVTNADSSVTATTTTISPSGAVTVETATSDSSGKAIASSSSDPNKGKPEMQKFCETSPNAPACKQSSWSGSCGSFTYDGDAIIGEISREIHQRNCEMFISNSASAFGAQVVAGTDGTVNPAAAGARTTINLASSIDQTAFMSGTITDQTIDLGGTRGSLTLPFSEYIWVLAAMGNLLMAASLLVAGRIVIGSA